MHITASRLPAYWRGYVHVELMKVPACPRSSRHLQLHFTHSSLPLPHSFCIYLEISFVYPVHSHTQVGLTVALTFVFFSLRLSQSLVDLLFIILDVCLRLWDAEHAEPQQKHNLIACNSTHSPNVFLCFPTLLTSFP